MEICEITFFQLNPRPVKSCQSSKDNNTKSKKKSLQWNNQKIWVYIPMLIKKRNENTSSFFYFFVLATVTNMHFCLVIFSEIGCVLVAFYQIAYFFGKFWGAAMGLEMKEITFY